LRSFASLRRTAVVRLGSSNSRALPLNLFAQPLSRVASRLAVKIESEGERSDNESRSGKQSVGAN
jgi:hypothetical protein